MKEQSWHVPRLIVAWVAALVVSLSIIFYAPAEQRFEWLASGIGFTILLTFALQLGTAQREGFITRLSFSAVGSVLIIGVAEAIALLVG